MNQAKRSIDELEPEAPPPVGEQPSLVWTPEMVKDVEAFIENLADRYLQFKKDEAGADQRYLEETGKHNRHMAYVLTAFLAIVTGIMSLLSASGRVSGDALLFLAGTITGYVLLFIQRLILAPARPEKEEAPEL